MIKQRVITAFFLIAALLLILWFSSISWVLPLASAILAAVGVYELLCVTGARKSKATLYICLGSAIIIPLLPIPHYTYLLSVTYTAAVITFAYMMYAREKLTLKNTAAVTAVSLMLAVLFKSLAELRVIPYGLQYLIAAILICIITDTAAFFVGRAWGKHKLAPKISPKKTMEGALGGTLCSVILFVLIGVTYEALSGQQINFFLLILWSLSASILAQFGDLSLSVIKRIVGVKDYGKILPGHGGILDRFDSYLFALPYTLLFCFLFGGFIR